MTGDVRMRQSRWYTGFCLFMFLTLGACNTLPGGTGTTGATLANTASSAATPSVEASLLEQLSLERVNRARLKPVAEAAAAGIDLNEGVPPAETISTSPKQAVAMNGSLRNAAIEHSRDMLQRDYFEHNTPEGVTPFDRMTNAGYIFIAAGENLAWRGTTGSLDEVEVVETEHTDLFVDTGIADRGHRTTMLAEDFREVGISIERGDYYNGSITFDSIMQTQDFGLNPHSRTFVLGVVYDDTNGNGQYDHGEGAADAAVTLAGVEKSTNAAGGYSFEVLVPGTYTLSFAGVASQALTIADGDRNIKVDLVNGTTVVVNLGLGPLD